jgi:hypothetical protein
MQNALTQLCEVAAARHAQNGGCSLSLMNGASPDDGFMVSLLGNEAVIDPRLGRIVSYDRIRNHIVFDAGLEDIRRLNLMNRAYLGTWHDEKTGLSYIDISILYGTPGEAIDAARRNKQKAYFDVKAGETIYL